MSYQPSEEDKASWARHYYDTELRDDQERYEQFVKWLWMDRVIIGLSIVGLIALILWIEQVI